LQSENKIKKQDNLWSVRSFKPIKPQKTKTKKLKLHKDINNYIQSIQPYKVSHPLDFEWRNSQQTIDFFLDLISKTNSKKERTLLLGMPTLFINSFFNKLPRNITLVDQNNLLLNSIEEILKGNKNYRIINENIFYADPNKIGKYKNVIMDPPWYSDHFYHFIWVASLCIEIGGTLLVSLPPINTRPGIAEERIEWFSFCQKTGLCLQSLNSQKLEYISPFFEFNAFRAAGLKDISPFWRKGDLAIFKKVHDAKVSRPRVAEIAHTWIEKEINSIRFRVKAENKITGSSTLSFKHIIKGDILPTVSSRDNRKNNANLWTSGNRIFEVSDTQKFINCIDNYKNSVTTPSENDKIASEFIGLIFELESKEYQNYLDWLQYAVETQNH
ncbi:MAG TPA: hypothetical protein VNX01_00435, partial [Bacteroidia bacterium]|nr:hypothetical protein [Bacteroidia bacterium]